MHVDLFNGDADGILARHQFRLFRPLPKAQLISGVKRDVLLCQQLLDMDEVDSITVFDISLESNEDAVQALMAKGCQIDWFDHHRRGSLKDDAQLSTQIDLSPKTCTSLIVNSFTEGTTLPWAIAGAYGDNLQDVAQSLALDSGFDEKQCHALQNLGETLNYNGYGETRADLAVWPVDLSIELQDYSNPFDYIAQSPLFEKITFQKEADQRTLGQAEILHLSTSGEVTLLPTGAASRRMSGLFSNEKVNAEPDLAHAIVTLLDDGRGYRISIRAPKNRPLGADELASRFPTGGGRSAAGGVNALPKHKIEAFCQAFDEVFSC